MAKEVKLIPENKKSEHQIAELEKAIAADKEKRTKEFHAEVQLLCEKYKCDIGAEAFIHEGKILARPAIFAR